jgi:hypothetical protein
MEHQTRTSINFNNFMASMPMVKVTFTRAYSLLAMRALENELLLYNISQNKL